MTKKKRIQVPIPFPVKSVNCYYIPGSVPTLIDTGVNLQDTLEAIKRGIEAQGGKLEDVRRIIATHGHADHIGLAGRIAEISGAEVFVHKWDTVRWADRGGEHAGDKHGDFRTFFLEAGLPTDSIDELVASLISGFRKMCHPVSTERMLEHGMVFKFDDFDLEAIHTPGHSPGCVCLWNRADRELFTGDTLLPALISNPTIEKTGSTDYKSLVGHQASLELIGGLDVKRVFPGHGLPFDSLEARLRDIRGYHGRRTKQILRILGQKDGSAGNHDGKTQYMVATELFGSISGRELFFAVSSARAYLDALEEQGLATRLKEGTRHFYRSKAS
ncbi:MAG: MBL fold metallo-hydrolase [Desulfomonile tiedjei]|nr:MBL fold metallo-hydrolase [Desulfomonile tiedjei]